MTIYEYLGITKEALSSIDVPRNYVTYRLIKSNGKSTRRIDAPLSGLKRVQNIILYRILYEFKPHEIAHGFVKGRSPRTNAAMHVGKKYLIKIDLENFFGSIRIYHIEKLLRYLLDNLSEKGIFTLVDDEDCLLLANILCLNGSVPQGAPSSPALTNLWCYWLDGELEKLKLNYNIQITRYADDITISLDDKSVIGEIIVKMKQLIHSKGLRVNNKKFKVCSCNSRQRVTGVIVNTKLNTSKESWRTLRAALHNASRSENVSEKMIQKLRGQIEWLRSLNPVRGSQYLEKLGQLNVVMPLDSI